MFRDFVVAASYACGDARAADGAGRATCYAAPEPAPSRRGSNLPDNNASRCRIMCRPTTTRTSPGLIDQLCFPRAPIDAGDIVSSYARQGLRGYRTSWAGGLPSPSTTGFSPAFMRRKRSSTPEGIKAIFFIPYQDPRFHLA